jgi:hypothetical protein
MMQHYSDRGQSGDYTIHLRAKISALWRETLIGDMKSVQFNAEVIESGRDWLKAFQKHPIPEYQAIADALAHDLITGATEKKLRGMYSEYGPGLIIGEGRADRL